MCDRMRGNGIWPGIDSKLYKLLLFTVFLLIYNMYVLIYLSDAASSLAGAVRLTQEMRGCSAREFEDDDSVQIDFAESNATRPVISVARDRLSSQLRLPTALLPPTLVPSSWDHRKPRILLNC